jgi:hypothetical protein
MKIHIGKFTLASPTIISSVTSTTVIVLSVARPMEQLGTEFISMQPTLATLTSLYGWSWVVTENFFCPFLCEQLYDRNLWKQMYLSDFH